MNKDNIIHVQKPEGTNEPELVEAVEVTEETGQTLDLGAPETIISMELKKFDVNKEAIALKKAEYENLTIAGVEDKKGYEAVDTARKVMMKMRTTTDKVRKNAKAKYLKIGKGIDEYAAELEADIVEVEISLENKLKAIDDAARIAEEEAERQREERYHERKKLLLGNGMVYTGTNYVIGEGETALTVDEHAIRLLEDEQFDDIILKAASINAEQLQAKRRKEEQAQKDREDLQKQKDEIEAMKKERRQLRTDKMLSLGFVDATGGDWEINNRAFNDVIITGKDIADLSTDEWNSLNEQASAMSGVAAKALEDLKAEEAEETRRKEQEQKEIEEMQQLYSNRAKILDAAGYKLDEFSVKTWVSKTYPAISVKATLTKETTDEQFEQAVQVANNQVIKMTEALAAIQQRENQVELLGYTKEQYSYDYSFRSKYHPESCNSIITPEDFDKEDAEWVEFLQEAGKAVKTIQEEDAAHEKAEAERKESERQASLTDAQKATEWLVTARTNIPPDVQGERFKNLFGSIKTLYGSIESLIAEVNAAQPETGNE